MFRLIYARFIHEIQFTRYKYMVIKALWGTWPNVSQVHTSVSVIKNLCVSHLVLMIKIHEQEYVPWRLSQLVLIALECEIEHLHQLGCLVRNVVDALAAKYLFL
jgi:hypothetical protein